METKIYKDGYVTSKTTTGIATIKSVDIIKQNIETTAMFSNNKKTFIGLSIVLTWDGVECTFFISQEEISAKEVLDMIGASIDFFYEDWFALMEGSSHKCVMTFLDGTLKGKVYKSQIHV